jgi:serine/threonine-protein kinase
MSEIVDRLNAALSGRYAIERELGEGGMATVYLAQDLRHERSVALKILKPELAAVLGAERFLSEIKTTANLQHPHILPLFDSGEADGFLFYVMPYMEDETLRDRLDQEKQLPVGEAVRIARSVAGALQVAHEAGVIHRDIKPANILLSRGEPVVADFGIALAVSQAGGGGLTETGLSLGTPYYMSPEQATADRDPGRASDVYSLGCVLYEMLIGDPPHTGSSAQAVLAKILTEEPRAVTSMRKTVPVNVADAVAKALERLPADRFDSADAFTRALGDPGFRHALPGLSPVGGAAPETSTGVHEAAAAPASRHPAAVVLPWAFAVLATVAAVAGWMRADTAVDGGPTELWMDAGVDSLRRGAFVSVSPDGRTFVMSAREADAPLYLRTAANPDWRALPGTEDAYLPTFSPDGQRIAYMADDQVMTVSVSGGNPLTLYSSGGEIFEPHWGANGDIVVSANDGIRRIRSSGGVDTLALDGTVFWPYLLPDGSGVLYGEGAFDATSIKLVDLETDSVRVLIDEGNRPIYLESGHILFAHPDGGLQILPFDLDRHEVTGAPAPVLDGVVARGFAVSGSGTLVYQSGLESFGGLKSRFLLVGFDGSVDTLRIPEQSQFDVRVSPDGTRMAFEVTDGQGEGAQIYTYDLERRTGPTQLTFDGYNTAPVWSPDGTRVAYRHDRTSIFAKSVDDGSPGVALLEDSVGVTPTAWTAANDIVFHRAGEGGTDLFRLPSADTMRPVELLRTDFREAQAVVSPDGHWFAYTSYETDQGEIFVRAYPSSLGQRNVSRGVGFEPQWSADGRAVLFMRRGAASSAITSVTVELEPTFAAGDPKDIWVGRVMDFDVHPDGESLVVLEILPNETAGEEEPEPSRIVVVLNWFEHIRARLESVGGGQ